MIVVQGKVQFTAAKSWENMERRKKKIEQRRKEKGEGRMQGKPDPPKATNLEKD